MPRTRVIQAGESWASIAGSEYQNQRLLVELAKANGGLNRVLHPGDVIDLPDFDTAQQPYISQDDWNQITGANNFVGGGSGGSNRSYPPVPQIGAPRNSTRPNQPPVPTIGRNPYVTPNITNTPTLQTPKQTASTSGHSFQYAASRWQNYRGGNVQTTPGALPRPSSTRQGNINQQRQANQASAQRGASYNAMAQAYGRQPGASTTNPNAWRLNAGIYGARPGITPPRVDDPNAAIVRSIGGALGANARAASTIVRPPDGSALLDIYWALANKGDNKANNRPTNKVQTVPDNRTVSYGTEGSPLTQAQFNAGASYTGQAFEYFLTSQNRRQLPRFMTSDLARVLPFSKRAGVSPEDWLRGMGYEEFMPGRWRIMDPVSKYAARGGGRYSSGRGGGGYVDSGGGGRYYGGGGGYPWYPFGGNNGLPLTNWRVGL